MRAVKSLRKNKRGAALAEFALLFPAFALLFFGALDVGFMMWQVQQGEIAVKRAVRVAATRAVLDGSIDDCGPNNASAIPGTLCSDLAIQNDWGGCLINDISSPGTPSAPCGTDVARVATEIMAFYPRAAQGDVRFTFSGSGLGFEGLGKPVPIVTVQFENIPFQTIMIGIFGNFVMSPQSASAPAEDLTNGPAT